MSLLSLQFLGASSRLGRLLTLCKLGCAWSLTLLGAALSSSAQSPVPPVVEPATISFAGGAHNTAAVSASYQVATGKRLAWSADVPALNLPAGSYTAREFVDVFKLALEAVGSEIVSVTDSLDYIAPRSLRQSRESEVLPRVTVPAPEPVSAASAPVSAPSGVLGSLMSGGIVPGASEPVPAPSGPVVVICAEIGAVTLGRKYESGVDFLAAMDAFQPSNVAGGLAFGAGISRGLRGLQFGASSRPLSAYVKALDSDGDYQSTARPRMQVVSGQVARIATGQRVAVPSQTLTSNFGGPSTSSNITYQNVELSLEVVPTVLDSGLIALRITQSDDSISGSQIIAGNAVPTISSQTFSTQTVVRPLHTIALGGMKIERTRSTKTGVRGLAKIPVLGRLFRVDSSNHEASELLIFITAWVQSAGN